jgi:hypothetical protein
VPFQHILKYGIFAAASPNTQVKVPQRTEAGTIMEQTIRGISEQDRHNMASIPITRDTARYRPSRVWPSL